MKVSVNQAGEDGYRLEMLFSTERTVVSVAGALPASQRGKVVGAQGATIAFRCGVSPALHEILLETAVYSVVKQRNHKLFQRKMEESVEL